MLSTSLFFKFYLNLIELPYLTAYFFTKNIFQNSPVSYIPYGGLRFTIVSRN